MALQPLLTSFYPSAATPDTDLPPRSSRVAQIFPADFDSAGFFRYLLGRDKDPDENFYIGFQYRASRRCECYVTVSGQDEISLRPTRLFFSVLMFDRREGPFSRALAGTRIDCEANEILTQQIRSQINSRETADNMTGDILPPVLKPIVLSYLLTPENFLHKMIQVKGRELFANGLQNNSALPSWTCLSASTSEVITENSLLNPAPVGTRTDALHLPTDSAEPKQHVVEEFFAVMSPNSSHAEQMPTALDVALERPPAPLPRAPVEVHTPSRWESVVAFFENLCEGICSLWQSFLHCLGC